MKVSLKELFKIQQDKLKPRIFIKYNEKEIKHCEYLLETSFFFMTGYYCIDERENKDCPFIMQPYINLFFQGLNYRKYIDNKRI